MTAIKLAIGAIALAVATKGWALAILVPVGIALGLAVGGFVAGLRARDNGDSFWDGFAYFIRFDWAMTVAISSVLFAVTMGIGAGVSGMGSIGVSKAAAAKKGGVIAGLPNAVKSKGLGKLDWSKKRFDGMTTEQHVRLHEVANNAKSKHSVFSGDAVKITNRAWKNRGNAIVTTNTGNGNTVYTIPFKKAGMTGGKSVIVPSPCNSVTIVIQKGTSNLLVTAFPS